MAEDKKDNGTSKFWLGAVLGTIAGTIAGIIIAPKSGEETRKDIAMAGKKAGQKARSRWGKIFGRKEPAEQKRLTAGKILEEPKE